MLFVVGVMLCGLIGLYVNVGGALEVSRLSPVTVATLRGEAVSPGDEVLVEGYISSENEIVYPEASFVAYLYERRRISRDDNGQPKPEAWRLRDKVTPPLLLTLPDGAVQIENDDYRIEGAHVIEGAEIWVPGSHLRYTTTRYRGLVVGDPVIAVGKVRSQGTVPRIEAEFVSRGTREAYIAGHRTGGLISCVGSTIVALIGGAVLFWEQIRRIFRH